MNSKTLKVIVAEDHHVVRKGLVSIVSGFERVGHVDEAENGKVLLTKLEKQSADVVLMDIQMPLIDGIQATEDIVTRFPKTKILVLSAFEEDSIVLKLLEIGAHGYLSKNVQPKELEKAIYAVHDNDFYQNETTTKILRQGVKRKKPSSNQTATDISERELEVLKLLCQELSAKEIGDKLNIAEKTVHSHRLHLMKKTKAKNNIGLVLFALNQGILTQKS